MPLPSWTVSALSENAKLCPPGLFVSEHRKPLNHHSEHQVTLPPPEVQAIPTAALSHSSVVLAMVMTVEGLEDFELDDDL